MAESYNGTKTISDQNCESFGIGNMTEVHQLVDMFNGSIEGRRHVHYFASIPDDLVPYMPGFWWDQKLLFALDLQSKPFSVSDLIHFQDIPVWRSSAVSSLFMLTGREILAAPEHYPQHWSRIQQADLSYPIILYRKNHRDILLDGYHRLHRAIYEGNSQIACSFLQDCHVSDVLMKDGFLGELNATGRHVPDFVVKARAAARDLLDGNGEDAYPRWQ